MSVTGHNVAGIHTLDGATNAPAPETSPRTAGEFAARWNTLTPEEREDWFVQLLHQRDTAYRCFIADHVRAVEQLGKSVNADVVIAWLGSLHIMLHDTSINPMVRVSNARHRVAAFIEQVEGQVGR